MKSAASRQARRRIAAGALALTAAFGVTGCSAVSPIATSFRYHPSDGVNLNPIPEVGFRNVAVVATEGANPEGRLMGSLSNRTDRDLTATLTVNGTSFTVDVPARDAVNLETRDDLIVPNVGARTGEMVATEVTARGAQGSSTGSADVPVLSGTLPEYRHLVPGEADASQLTEHLYQETAHYGTEGGH
ncbi:hypothetical protein [Micrococcus sp.]|uniref:hypothetical protein n=1 Tax=Micrococcus sp. TaxID=1271 RepID=UPI002A9196AF|nr:hypothetical protein [Micrococcus sp.]MDY6054741.1 hypothetical protein [Micrococcus sp.]